MIDKFIFSFNGDEFQVPISMEKAIEIARKKAIHGMTVVLKVGSVLLGKYYPNPNSPLKVTDPRTRAVYTVDCCNVDIKLPRKRY